MKRRRS